MPALSTIREYGRQPVVLTILLTIVTLGLYVPYWMLRQSRCAHRVLPEKPIALFVMVSSIVLTVASTLLLVPEYMGHWNALMQRVDNAVTLLDIIFYLTWIFMLRHRIHLSIGAGARQYLWFSPVLTFFFGPYYLQYKINDLQKLAKKAVHSWQNECV